MTDIVIATVPYIEFYLPPAGPAALKGHLESNGISCDTMDLNISLKKNFTDKTELNEVISFLTTEEYTIKSKSVQHKVDTMVNNWCKELLSTNPTWIGLSVFSRDSLKSCELTVKKMKELKHNSKIMLGGMGITKDTIHQFEEYVDAWIIGEGEEALVNLVRGNMNAKGINGQADTITDLNKLGVPNYNDYDLDAYDTFYDNERVVQITGSRGCVRNCTFCNVAAQWPKFVWRSGQHIFDEIKTLYETKGVKNYFFTDSLINGNMKEYLNMIELLANYNNKHNAGIRWGGQYIIRRRHTTPQDYFSMTAESGAYNLAIGIESGSDNVLTHMRKHFTRDDTDFFAEGFSKHKITVSYLMLIGYPTETDEDFKQTLDLFFDHTKYVADGTILGATLNMTMAILPHTPVETMKELYEVDTSAPNSNIVGWRSKVVPGLDWKRRLERRLIADKLLQELHWPILSNDRDLTNLYNVNETYKKWITKSILKNNKNGSLARSFMTQL
jgi:radical SAM superfamily enzyme YgiQ (UPF0313 family)|tara:strand:+ start:68 stop:1567 length:1500 start_codon:yes stop_codon:yes gene_type:complete